MTTTVANSTMAAPRRHGSGHWFRSFGHMVKWNLMRMRLVLPGLVLVQVFTSAGLVLGFSLLYADISPEQALYLGTGAVIIALVMVGVVTGPQLIAEQRLSGSSDWFESLPIPRSANAAAWTVLNVLAAFPGAVTALFAVWVRFDVELHISPLVVPAVLLVLVAGTLIGYAYAHLLPNAKTVALIAQVMVFVVFGFSPVAYPPGNLPGWLATLHTYLPFVHMADLIRAGLTNGLVDEVGSSFAVVTAWGLSAALGATWALRRRP